MNSTITHTNGLFPPGGGYSYTDSPVGSTAVATNYSSNQIQATSTSGSPTNLTANGYLGTMKAMQGGVNNISPFARKGQSDSQQYNDDGTPPPEEKQTEEKPSLEVAVTEIEAGKKVSPPTADLISNDKAARKAGEDGDTIGGEDFAGGENKGGDPEAKKVGV